MPEIPPPSCDHEFPFHRAMSLISLALPIDGRPHTIEVPVSLDAGWMNQADEMLFCPHSSRRQVLDLREQVHCIIQEKSVKNNVLRAQPI